MASLVITIENIQPNPLAPLGGGQSDRSAAFQALENVLKGLESGEVPVTASGNPVVTLSNTTALGTATVTMAGPFTAGDTVTIGGQALTATKANATATVTSAAPIAGDTLTVQGVVFTFVAGTATAGPRTIPVGLGTDTLTAAAIAGAINSDLQAAATVVSATSSAAVVTLRANAAGTPGNALVVSSSNNTRLATTAFSGGAAVANNTFDPGNSAANAAANLLAAVNASTTAAVSGQVLAYPGVTTNIVVLKARAVGAGGTVSLAKVSTNVTVSAATINLGQLSSGTVVNL